MKRSASSEQVTRNVVGKTDVELHEPPLEASHALEGESGLDAFLDAAIRAVGHGSRIALAVQKRYCKPEKAGSLEKDDTSPVTVADYAVQCLVTAYLSVATGAETLLRLVAEEDSTLLEQGAAGETRDEIKEVTSLLNEHFPFQDFDSGACKQFSGEDVLALLHRGNDPGGDKGSCWVLDPIDGTKGFIRGAQYAIGLGLLQDGKPVLGAMACPNLPPIHGDVEHRAEGAGFVFYGYGSSAGMLELAAFNRISSGKRGSISWPDVSAPLKVIPPSPQTKLVFCESYESKHRGSDDIRPQLKCFEQECPLRLDSMGKYALIARGDAHVYLRGGLKPGKVEKIWDHAAAVPILLAAGGQVTDLLGKALNFGCGRELNANHGVLATNGVVHAEILSAIVQLRGESEAAH